MSIRDDVAKEICSAMGENPNQGDRNNSMQPRWMRYLIPARGVVASLPIVLAAAGYRIVPVEASWEMLGEGAGAATAVPSEDGLIREPEVRAAWQAMLAAAPPLDVESEKP